MLTFCRCSFHYSLHQQGCNDGGKVVVVSLLKQKQVDCGMSSCTTSKNYSPSGGGKKGAKGAKSAKGAKGNK